MTTIIDKESLRKQAQSMAEVLKLIANENRLLSICFLGEDEKSVGEITSFLEISQPAVSQILLKMKEEGVLSSRNSAQKIFYKVENKEISKLIKEISHFCKKVENASFYSKK